ncbi:MAG TPA: S-methyl-5'-thioadenosine phosphorylase [Firmicutes bacterium]|jgi:5'-methylthioadenosine phosphorylase|nr:S-methyl-5'-thioadenosine phosphorylase [Bacillota bacterium]
MIGIIGGSGVKVSDLLADPIEQTTVTPWGEATVWRGHFAGQRVLFLPRHGPGHKVAPHAINYRANIAALWHAGARQVIATAAVGSVNSAAPPGSFVICDQFIDFTVGRQSTFFGPPVPPAPDDSWDLLLARCAEVVHTDFTEPYCPNLRYHLIQAATELQLPHLQAGCYVCTEGPRYETPAEIRIFRRWEADVVGMTGVPEVALARELGLCYATVALVTNMAAGLQGQHLAHTDVVALMRQRGQALQDLLKNALGRCRKGAGPGCNCRGERS